MSARDYTPGSTAVITIEGRGEHTAVRDGIGNWLVGDIDDLRVIPDHDEIVTMVHPLTTIDLRDTKQVDALAQALADAGAFVIERGALLEALLAITPRPPEPRGLGAVIAGLAGHRHVRGPRDDDRPWLGSDGKHRAYEDIQVLSVLATGVPA